MSYRIRYPGSPEESAASPKIRWKAAITIGVLLFVSVLTFPGIRTYAEMLFAASRPSDHAIAMKGLAGAWCSGDDVYEAVLLYCRKLLALA